MQISALTANTKPHHTASHKRLLNAQRNYRSKGDFMSVMSKYRQDNRADFKKGTFISMPAVELAEFSQVMSFEQSKESSTTNL